MLAWQQPYFLALTRNVIDLGFKEEKKKRSQCQSTSLSVIFDGHCHIFLWLKTASREAIDVCFLSSRPPREVVLEANIFHSVHAYTCSDVVWRLLQVSCVLVFSRLSEAPPFYFLSLAGLDNLSALLSLSVCYERLGCRQLEQCANLVSVSGEHHYTPADGLFLHAKILYSCKANESPVMISRVKSSCDCVCGCGAKVWK